MRRIDLTGQRIFDITVIKYLGNKKYLCQCKCGTYREICTDSLKRGYKCVCDHNYEEEHIGKKFGDLTVTAIINKHVWECKCSCGTVKQYRKYDLEHGKSTSCGCKHFKDLTGQQIGEWTILSYVGNKKFLCRCSCGKEREVHSATLKNGQSLSCGHDKIIYDLTNKRFGDWTVMRYAGSGKWECKCSCGKVSLVGGFQLRNGLSKSCGHDYNEFIDLTGQKIGELQVEKYIGDRNFLCLCSCGKHIIMTGRSLRAVGNKSCGHLVAFSTSLRKNGNRTQKQIEAALSRDKLLELLKEQQVTFKELSDRLGLSYSHTVKLCHKYGVQNLVSYQTNSSYDEDELYKYIKENVSTNIKVLRQDRTVLAGRELDIYLPELKLAFEFNGTYWHSTVHKDKNYHQDKTIECARKGINVIHIFEYEWRDEIMKEKLKQYISFVLGNFESIGARETVVKEIDNQEAIEFLEQYHLQGGIKSPINIALVHEHSVVGVMTLGKPRYSLDFDYEIHRVCFLPRLRVVGGVQKMYKYFVNKYKPSSVMTYSDISKFTGNIYSRLGFKPSSPNPFTEPGYFWVEANKNKVIPRYKTQKQKLIDLGLDKFGDTEDEIMENLGYLKVYNSGNIRMEWVDSTY